VSRTVTYAEDTDVIFHAGGNPPVAAGLFDRDGNRLAWWPAGYEATQENMDKVMRLVWAREDEEPVSRKAIREVLP